ncbi:dephospho-CoA kinase [Lacticaseibacillus hegangensis]|uniref:Dephospho-CoA kinase n=1 Tax=Lacticaseibacillus hegangensis TaxID=2486010 RepID=A0ABW4D0W2_9LACO|nr:dephospho-CoA kinase [Lacticaseibacillus hegangensis]
MTYVLGLTGGIATGKSTVAGEFRRHGCPVVDADEVAREIVEPGRPALRKIEAAFGPGVIRSDGSLDRKALGDIVFNDAAKLAQLNAIDHPYLRAAIEDALAAAKATSAKVVVGEIPLLYETHYEDSFDGVAVVTLPPNMQLERLMARDGLTQAQAQARIQAQLPLSEKIQRADFLIDNSQGPAVRKQQVEELLAHLSR